MCLLQVLDATHELCVCCRCWMPLMSCVFVAGVVCHSRVVCLLQVLDATHELCVCCRCWMPLMSCVSAAVVGCHS